MYCSPLIGQQRILSCMHNQAASADSQGVSRSFGCSVFILHGGIVDLRCHFAYWFVYSVTHQAKSHSGKSCQIRVYCVLSNHPWSKCILIRVVDRFI